MHAAWLGGSYLMAVFLLLLPAAACVLAGRRMGISNPVLLLAAGFVGSGLLAFATFWLYLLNREVGHAAALAINAGCGLYLAQACRHGFARWRQLRDLAPVTGVFISAGLFNLALGYLHGGLNPKADIAPNRFLAGLPGDNKIPLLFAQQLQSHLRPLPHYLAWGYQSSDRPPLQTGYYLLEQSVVRNGAFDVYQVFATALQSSWIFGLWALLYAARKGRGLTSLSLAAGLFSTFTIVNTFFTWPKLLSATGVLLAWSISLTPQFKSFRDSRTAGVLCGASLGLGMLAHPGGVFALPGIVLVLLLAAIVPALRPHDLPRPGRGFLLSGAVSLVAAYLPWLLYQRLYQPPANALLEMQMANTTGSIHGKSTVHVIVRAYRKLGPHRIVHDKVLNLLTPFDHTLGNLEQTARAVFDGLLGRGDQAAVSAHLLVTWQFYYLGPILGLTGVGILILASRSCARAIRRRCVLSPMSYGFMWMFALIASGVVWAMVLFGPAATLAHQGTYAVEFICLALGVAGWWSVSPKIAGVVVGVSSLITFWIFVQFTPDRTMHGSGLSRGVSTSDAMLLAPAVLACLASLWWLARAEGPTVAGTGRLAGLTVVRARQAGEALASALPESELAEGTPQVAGVAARSDGDLDATGRQ